MDFIGREKETEWLRALRAKSERSARFAVVTGRRRIGKTALLLHAFGDAPMLYFFVARQAERELCETFRAEIENKLGEPVGGAFASFADVFDYVMRVAEKRPLVLVIDEFQDFLRVAPHVYSRMQAVWDLRHGRAKIALVVCGSVHSLMNRLFRDRKEPLYGRQTDFVDLKPFGTETLRSVLASLRPRFKPEDLLAFWALTGGVAKYVSLLADDGALSKEKMVDAVLSPTSPFVGEGRAALVEEFGKDYGTYFSILSAVSRGRTDRARIEQTVGREVGGYLTRLETEYGLLAKRQPLFEKSLTKSVRYALDDEFFRFWFRFVHKNAYMVEIGAFDALRTIVRRDWDVFAGLALERWFRTKMAESGGWTRIGSWWDRKGENEIDIVAENELEKRAAFFEVKLSPARFDPEALRVRTDAFLRATGAFGGYRIERRGLSPLDM